MAFRPRHVMRAVRLVDGSIRQLDNWGELLRGTLAQLAGGSVEGAATLRFRDGLEIGLVPGGYGGFSILFREIFVEHCYRPTSDFSIRPGWRVLDVGANMGVFTCYASHAAKDVRVVAVEPVSVYVEQIRDNVARNRFDQVSVVRAAAVGAPTDEVPIRIWFTKSGEPKMTTSPPPGHETRTERVAGKTLAQLLDEGGFDRCDLMKLDIEGAEYPLFDQTPQEVWARIDRVVMETHEVEGRSEAEPAEVLRKQGFDVRTGPHYLWATRKSARG